jgi:hypothetical protein
MDPKSSLFRRSRGCFVIWIGNNVYRLFPLWKIWGVNHENPRPAQEIQGPLQAFGQEGGHGRRAEFLFVMIDGKRVKGKSPGESPAFREAMMALYGVSYTLK